MLSEAVSLLRQSTKTIALTGAGVSTESGIPDFRSRGGLWSRYDPAEYGTLGAFRRDPVKVWKMLAELLTVVKAEPNDGHRAMAKLEHAGFIDGIITQNIDGLHQKAGSRNVVEFHGSLASFSCLSCGMSFALENTLGGKLPPHCNCGEVLKPDIVFFDESIPSPALRQTRELLLGAEVLLVAGTSCQVAPASTIPWTVKQHGGKVIEVNLESVLNDLADYSLLGSFSRTMMNLLVLLNKEKNG